MDKWTKLLTATNSSTVHNFNNKLKLVYLICNILENKQNKSAYGMHCKYSAYVQ